MPESAASAPTPVIVDPESLPGPLGSSLRFDRFVRQMMPFETHVFALHADLTIRSEITGYVLGGSVTLSRPRGARFLSLTISSPDGRLVPATVADELYPDNLLMVRRGIGDEMATLGIFVVDKPEVSTDSREIRLSGQDRWRRGAAASFPRAGSYEEGTPIATIVREWAILAGLGDFRMRLNDGGAALGVERPYLPSEMIVPALRDTVRNHALRVSVEDDWTLDLRPAPDPLLERSNPVWPFAAGTEALLLGVTKGLSSASLFNAARVAGEGPGRESVYAEVEVTDPANPAHRDRIGYRPSEVYSSPLITDEEQAWRVAVARLPGMALVTADYQVSSLAHPFLRSGHAVSLVEAYTRSDTVLWIDELQQPLSMADEMGFSSSELVPLR